MKRWTIGSIIICAYSALCAGTILANTNTVLVKPEKVVTIYGTVRYLRTENEFVLRDDKGDKIVRIPYAHSPIFNEGDSVTITGTITDSKKSTYVTAYSITHHQRSGI